MANSDTTKAKRSEIRWASGFYYYCYHVFQQSFHQLIRFGNLTTSILHFFILYFSYLFLILISDFLFSPPNPIIAPFSHKSLPIRHTALYNLSIIYSYSYCCSFLFFLNFLFSIKSIASQLSHQSIHRPSFDPLSPCRSPSLT